jgi:hypothetical protein
MNEKKKKKKEPTTLLFFIYVGENWAITSFFLLGWSIESKITLK